MKRKSLFGITLALLQGITFGQDLENIPEYVPENGFSINLRLGLANQFY
jgi:hypothetical protein